MRPAALLFVVTFLWSLAPVLDESGLQESPSLLVMPPIAALAAVGARGWRDALLLPAAGLVLVLALFGAWTMAIGRTGILGALDFALAALPFHLLGTWLLVALLWWPGRKLRDRTRLAAAA